MPELPSACSFCAKRKSEVRNLMIGILITREDITTRNSICDECLGVQMTVVAFLNRPLFEQLVATARAYKPGAEPPGASH